MKLQLIRQLPGTLWSAVVMVVVLGIYLQGHIGIRIDHYGIIYGVFTCLLYLLPIFAGALADRHGYRPALLVAFTTLTTGYSLLGSVTDWWRFGRRPCGTGVKNLSRGAAGPCRMASHVVLREV